jgi:hypothetical protein
MLRCKPSLKYGYMVGTGLATGIMIIGSRSRDSAAEMMIVLAWPCLVLALNTSLTFAIVVKIWLVEL